MSSANIHVTTEGVARALRDALNAVIEQAEALTGGGV